MVNDSHSDVCLFAKSLHALHVVLHGGRVGDLSGTARWKPASLAVSHSLPVAKAWEEQTIKNSLLELLHVFIYIDI